MPTNQFTIIKKPVSGRAIYVLTVGKATLYYSYDDLFAIKAEGYSAIVQLSDFMHSNPRYIAHKDLVKTLNDCGFKTVPRTQLNQMVQEVILNEVQRSDDRLGNPID